jgi:ABC-type multidrug transport system fused ATPase/permease subunit
MARHQTGDAVRITTASASQAEDIAARQKRYLLAMGFRTVCFVAAIFVTISWARVVLIVAALILPYVAVVMANAGASRSDGFALLDGATGTRELPGGTDPGKDSGAHHL